MTDKVNCWPCSEFTLTDGFYHCARSVKSFPKRCGHFDYEPGNDYEERLFEKQKEDNDDGK